MSHIRTTLKGKVSKVGHSINGRSILGKKAKRQSWVREIEHTTREGLRQVIAFSQKPNEGIKGEVSVWDKNKKVSTVEFSENGRTLFKHILIQGLKTNAFYQKEGIATQVLSEIISIAKKRPMVKSILLSAREDNANALRMYKKFGFTEYSKFTEVQRGERVNCITMRLELDK